MKPNISRRLIALVCSAALFVSPLALAEDETTADEELDMVVLSLQQDPNDDEGLEAACVVLQLGIGFLRSGKVDATVFATLDGVYIGDENTYEGRGKHKRRGDWDDDERGHRHWRHHRSAGPICETLSPDGELGTAPLRDLLNGFLDAGGEVLLCPLCYAVRLDEGFEKIDDEDIYVTSPIPLLLEAKKVIDY